jgi:hypothetical protein
MNLPPTQQLLDCIGKQLPPIHLDAMTALCIIAGIQLASRHPGYKGPSSDIAISGIKKLQAILVEVVPEFKDIIEAGWNPELDVTI